MKTTFLDIRKKALLNSLHSRVNSRIKFLAQKKKVLMNGLKKKSDLNKIEKIRENILKQ